MENLYDNAVLVGFTLLIGIIGGLLIAMRNRAPVIQVGERDVETRSITGAVFFGFGIVFFIGFLYLMIPKDFRFLSIPSPANETEVGEEPVIAGLKLDTVVRLKPEDTDTINPPKKETGAVAPLIVPAEVGTRELIMIQSNAFSKVSNAEREVARLKQSYPAFKVLIGGELFHTGYGPFTTEEQAEKIKNEKGLSGKVIVFYY